MTARTQAWKDSERKAAAALGGKRVPITGRQRGDAPDVAHEVWAIEVKHRKTLPAWLHDAMDQAKASVRGTQVPIVVLHQHGQRGDNDYIVVRRKDFIDLYGEIGA